MKWYTKYLQVYEQPFDSAPKEAVDFVNLNSATLL